MASNERVLSGAQSPAVGTRTSVGVDVGEHQLVAAAPAHGRPDEAFVIDGDHVTESFRVLRAAATTLRTAGFDTTSAEVALVASFWVRLKGQLHDVAARTVRHARTFPGAVLVLEEIPYTGGPLFAHRHHDGEIGAWLLPTLQGALVAKAVAAGLPVAWVDPAGTSVECHRCGERGERTARAFECTADDCPVDVVDADASAAVSIAKRV